MPTILRSALVPYLAHDMYSLVCDIDSYPQFLPWCGHAQILESSDTHQLARVAISKRIEHSEFTTRNILDPDKSVQMTLVDGPFRHLQGSWQFLPLGQDACKVELEVDFEFSSQTLARVLSPAFTRVCDTLVSAFIQRADAVLGEVPT